MTSTKKERYDDNINGDDNSDVDGIQTGLLNGSGGDSDDATFYFRLQKWYYS